MRKRAPLVSLASLMLLVSALAPGQARASTIAIEVRNVEFVPAGVGAFAGDTIRFNTTSGTHDLHSYAGPDFHPGTMTAGQTVDALFPGGTIRYRCTVIGHSQLNGTTCTGMCGVLSDSPPTMSPPAITFPAPGQTVDQQTITVTGTASAPANRVRLSDNGGRIGDVPVSGGSFSRQFTFAAGSHTLSAIALDPDGFQSAPVSVTFTVAAQDVAPPTVTLGQPNALLNSNPLGVSGIATDDARLVSVAVRIRNLITGEVISPPVTCPACGTPSSTFNSQTAVPRGLHEVVAIATDGAGRTGQDEVTVLVI